MTDAEKREAARQFYYKWKGQGREDEDDRSYWLDILQRIMGADDATDRVEFQKKVIVGSNTKRIDAYIPETKIIIEQKSLGIPLDRKIHQSGGIELTPYEQAKRYNDNLPSSEKARWIVTSNFAEIWVYDMDTRVPEDHITKIAIADLQSHYSLLDFLLGKKVSRITEEMELSLKAGELVGKIYDKFLAQYNDPNDRAAQNSLNVLCVRLVFCLYAEDAGLFGDKSAFSRYIAQYEPKDIRQALLQLFRVLDTPLDERADLYLDEELEAFPYCNGGLFADENIIIPKITPEIKATLEESSHFDWSKISPTIFGAVFESTLNPETRRSGGMHYTSIENIHKLIDPLFLDELKAEYTEITKLGVQKVKETKLRAFQDKLSRLKFLDPACGSGNFLTETYMSLRRMENEVISQLQYGQIAFGDEYFNPIKVQISQFYGIEINDFAVTVAKTALWIAESQMMRETEDIVHMNLDFLPLKSNASIVEGNALRLDWETVVPKNELTYIMGNPPFVGYAYQSKEQKEDMKSIQGLERNVDYVASWYYKAVAYIQNTKIKCAFVSTNSITQGEQVCSVWEYLYNNYQLNINFAYRTFRWDSEANSKAHVHCVIIGFSCSRETTAKLFHDDTVTEVPNINPYLIAGNNVFIHKCNKNISNMPEMRRGNQPTDDGNFIFSEEEMKEAISAEPFIKPYIRPFLMGKDFIARKPRYCLWLVGVAPSEIKKSKIIMERVNKVREFRLNSSKAATVKKADTPTLFDEIKQVDSDYIAVPIVSSENRRYIPIDYLPSEIIAGNKLFMLPKASLYEFGILTSNVHMSWMRTVCGRLKSDYSYSNTIVYNNFPWPTPTEAQKAKIEATAQGILDARAKYPDDSLADLYDPLTMPPELRKAHQANDVAVMQAYGLDVKSTSEEDCVAFLMKLYQELTK